MINHKSLCNRPICNPWLYGLPLMHWSEVYDIAWVYTMTYVYYYGIVHIACMDLYSFFMQPLILLSSICYAIWAKWVSFNCGMMYNQRKKLSYYHELCIFLLQFIAMLYSPFRHEDICPEVNNSVVYQLIKLTFNYHNTWKKLCITFSSNGLGVCAPCSLVYTNPVVYRLIWKQRNSVLGFCEQ